MLARHPTATAAVVVFVITMYAYIRTLLPGVGSFDVAEFQTVSPTLGIAHEPGYPVFTLLGFVWTHFLFFADPAHMMNLLTAMCAALAASVLVFVARRAGLGPLAAVVAGLIFAFDIWARMIAAEVQSLHLLLALLVVLLWAQADAGDETSAVLMLIAAGIGFAHHRLMVAIAPPLMAWYFLPRWRRWIRPRAALTAAAALGTPLLAYAYLVLRQKSAPVVNSDMSHGWLAVARGDVVAANGTYFTAHSILNVFAGLPGHLRLLGGFVGLVVGLLALAGVPVVISRAPRLFVAFVLVFGAMLYIDANNFSPQPRYFLLPIAFIAVCAAAAGDAVLAVARDIARLRTPSRAVAIVAATVIAFAAVPAWAAAGNYRTLDRSFPYRDEALARTILASLPPRAVVWSYWDLRTTLAYLHYVEHVRPDVEVPDHRAYARYGCSFCEAKGDPVVARGLALDPRLSGRTVYYCTVFATDPSLGGGVGLTAVGSFSGPFGFGRLPASLYVVKPAAR